MKHQRYTLFRYNILNGEMERFTSVELTLEEAQKQWGGCPELLKGFVIRPAVSRMKQGGMVMPTLEEKVYSYDEG